MIEADLGHPVVSAQNYRAFTPPQAAQPAAPADAAAKESDADAPR